MRGLNEAPSAREPRPGELGAPQHPGWAERAKLAARSTEDIEAELAELQAKLRQADPSATARDSIPSETPAQAARKPAEELLSAEEPLSQEQLAARLADARQEIDGASGGEEEVKAAMEALETVRKVMKQNGHSDVRFVHAWAQPCSTPCVCIAEHQLPVLL